MARLDERTTIRPVGMLAGTGGNLVSRLAQDLRVGPELRGVGVLDERPRPAAAGLPLAGLDHVRLALPRHAVTMRRARGFAMWVRAELVAGFY